MNRVLINPHLWIIVAIITCGGILYYVDQIPVLQDIVIHTPFNVARYSIHRILSLIPVVYAAYIFGFYGGLATVVFISLALLPRPLFISLSPEAIVEVVAFLIIGLLVTWLIDREQKTVNHLERAQQELADSLDTVRNQSRLIASYYDISTIIYQTEDVKEIARNALHKVLEVTGADAGWIYLREENGELTLATSDGVLPRFVEDAIHDKVGDSPDHKAAKSGSLVVVNTDSIDFGSETLRQGEDQVVAVAPLLSKGGPQGTLGILTPGRQFSVEQSKMLTGLGIRIGLAVERANLDRKERFITEQLRLSEERYRALFENASEAIFVCSGSRRIISVNRAGEEITGYTYDELSGLTLDQLFSGSGPATIKKMLLEEMEIITIGRHEELRLMRKDGSDAIVELKVNPVIRNSQTIGWQAIARDVTEETQMHQNMQQYVAQITKAQEEERLRISRELHDETAQVLAVLSRSLDSVISSETGIPESIKSVLAKLREITDSVLKGVRRFSQDLRPSILDDLGLVPALEWLASDLEQYGIAPTVKVSGNQYRFTAEREIVIFRIAQEALSNVRKHSKASAVEMMIDFDEDALTLTLKDNGKGFSVPGRVSDLALSGKLGLMGMRERARLIRGTLIVQSELDSGTTVTLRVPN